MCGTSVALPAICVLTGETVDVVLVRKTVTWIPKWIYITLLAGVLIAGAASQVPEILVPLGLISLIGSLELLILGQPPIKAVRHESGVKFCR